MKSVGIIAEYNPFHNGHLYHLKEIKKMFPDYTIILVMSGNFMQRGETSVINKYTKTKIALDNNIDLVIELPFNFATQSADIFAKGSLQILNKLKVDYLIFGSETNDIQKLKSFAHIQLNNTQYDDQVKKYLNEGVNYPTALSKTLKEMTGKEIDTPNDILGLSYVREIIQNNYNIKPICIKRTSDYHDINANDSIISASNIRNKLKKKLSVKNYVPKSAYKYLNNDLSFIDNYYDYLKYSIIENIDNLNLFLTVDEGINNRIKKYIYTSKNYDELIKNIKTKRYTYNKISRMLCHILTGYKKSDKKEDVEYIRILGMNKKGQNYVNKIKKDIDVPLITKFTDLNKEYQTLELKLAYIYCLPFSKEKQEKYLDNEIKSKIIIQNKND